MSSNAKQANRPMAGNVPYVIERGFGYFSKDPVKTADAISECLGDDRLLLEMSNNAKQASQPWYHRSTCLFGVAAHPGQEFVVSQPLADVLCHLLQGLAETAVPSLDNAGHVSLLQTCCGHDKRQGKQLRATCFMLSKKGPGRLARTLPRPRIPSASRWETINSWPR